MIPSKRLALVFLVYAAIGIGTIATLMPPFQAADELAHAERAEQVARGGLIGVRSESGQTAGGLVDPGLARLAVPFDPIRFRPQVKVDASMKDAANSTDWGRIEWQPFPNTAIYPPWFYIPAAVTLEAGRAVGLSVAHTMILARIATGIASGAIAAVAIALAETGAPLLFGILCLPMSMALFAAISQDGPMIASAFLAAVLLGRSGKQLRSFVPGCILLALVVAARPAYLPLCFAPLLSPGRRLAPRLAGACAVAATTFLWVALIGRLVMPTEASRHVAAQLTELSHHPRTVLLLLHTTIHKQIVEGLPIGREFIGVLGWLDTTLPNPYYALAGLVLLLGLLLSRRTADGRAAPRDALLVAAAVLMLVATVAAIYATQYLSWSAIGGAFIDGVQGRYLLPVAPFLLFALPRRAWAMPRMVVLSSMLFPSLSILLTARAILVRYYSG